MRSVLAACRKKRKGSVVTIDPAFRDNSLISALLTHIPKRDGGFTAICYMHDIGLASLGMHAFVTPTLNSCCQLLNHLLPFFPPSHSRKTLRRCVGMSAILTLPLTRCPSKICVAACTHTRFVVVERSTSPSSLSLSLNLSPSPQVSTRTARVYEFYI